MKKAKRPDERLEAHEVFSSMPPSEALNMAVSYMMTEQVDTRGRPLDMATWDVSRAHLYGEARR